MDWLDLLAVQGTLKSLLQHHSSEYQFFCTQLSHPYMTPGSGGYPGEGNGYPLQYSCLENPMERSLVSYSPWGLKQLDMTEQLSMHARSLP